LNSLAVDSGGFVVFNVNNLEDALAEVQKDARQYYVVAYSPTNTNYDGKAREIDVRVKRPDVHVRARKRYVPVDPKDMLVPKR
jgi:VWFA-related protein